jgi:hypothetical protein
VTRGAPACDLAATAADSADAGQASAAGAEAAGGPSRQEEAAAGRRRGAAGGGVGPAGRCRRRDFEMRLALDPFGSFGLITGLYLEIK